MISVTPKTRRTSSFYSDTFSRVCFRRTRSFSHLESVASAESEAGERTWSVQCVAHLTPFIVGLADIVLFFLWADKSA
jgi:hypothetical protein